MTDPIEHVLYRLRNAQVLRYPFPHFYVEDVFPTDWYYDKLLTSLPHADSYSPMSYRHRAATNDVPACVEGMMDPRFGAKILRIFEREALQRFPHHDRPSLRSEVRFIRDEQGYAIGPHTDAPHKVVSLLFYLPEYSLHAHCGTSIFVHPDGKTCPGGPHHKFDGFKEVWTAPFLPNSCFGFFKTDNSWHGVREITDKIRRDVLLFNIYMVEKGEQSEIQAQGT